MKKSISVILALVGMAISGTTIMIYLNSVQSTCIEGKLPNGTCDSSKINDIERSVAIDGLQAIYNWKQPIEFTILAHSFDGCEQIPY